MKTIGASLLTYFVLLLSFPVAVATAFAAQTRVGSLDFAIIDAYAAAQMEDLRIPGLALGIVHGDTAVHLKGFGITDPSGRRVTPQTPFIIGSVSKSFTALAIMQLVEAGKVELDAPCSDISPGSVSPIRQLPPA